jgi:hypothetical protein
LPRSLTPDATTKQVPCVIIAAKTTNSCNCNVPGRKPVATEHEQAVAAAQADALNATNHWNCFCEITQTTGGAKDACENDPSTTPMIPGSSPPQQADGWCYIDGTTTPTIGNAKLVETCDASEKREVRFVGAGKGDPTEKATLFITCAGDNSN